MRSEIQERNVHVFWIDTNIYRSDNMNNLKAFKQLFSTLKLEIIFQETNSIQVLKYEISKVPKNTLTILITAASLPVEWYDWMENQNKVNLIGLFCLNQEGANLLATNIRRKIINTSRTCQDVVKFIQQRVTAFNNNS